MNIREKQFDKTLKIKEKEAKAKRFQEERKFSLEEKKEVAKKQKDIDKQTLPYYKEVNKAAKAAKDNNMRLKRMEEINEKGKLGAPLLNSVLQTVGKGVWGIGLNLDFLMTADAQELKKLSVDFLKNIKDYFGARITTIEVQNYLKTIPTLAQTRSGRRKIISNLRMFNNLATIRQDAMDEIIAENGGERPKNFESRLEKRIAPKIDRISELFKEQPLGAQNWLEGLIWY